MNTERVEKTLATEQEPAATDVTVIQMSQKTITSVRDAWKNRGIAGHLAGRTLTEIHG